VLVDDPQRPPVRGPFTAVPTDLQADLLEAAELLGQQWQADAGHEPQPAVDRFHPARVSSASYTARLDSQVTVTRSKLRCAPSRVRGLRRRTRPGARVPGIGRRACTFPGRHATREARSAI
jgi:hypothetical protein